MKETPIIMSGSHPRDILEGRKTMSRRTWGLEEVNKDPDNWFPGVLRIDGRWSFISKDLKTELVIKCPYGGVGDLLWVKETWKDATGIPYLAISGEPRKELLYKADGAEALASNVKWSPSIFMPRRASRILLEITEIRVEQLMKIDIRDIYAEGIRLPEDEVGYYGKLYVDAFHNLWDSLNAKRGYGWDKNKWVWPISFKEADHGQRPV